jgi:hypothetical protein
MKSLKIAFATAFIGMTMAFTPTRSYQESAAAKLPLLEAISPQFYYFSRRNDTIPLRRNHKCPFSSGRGVGL